MYKRAFTQTFGVVAGLIEKDGRFLLVKESQRDHPDSGKWNHPAGWIDLCENPIHAVKREVQEETGHEFFPKKILGIYSLVRKDIAESFEGIPHAIKIVFTGTLSDVKVSGLEDDVSETRWFSAEEIFDMGDELRDIDIKQMVKDYLDGKYFPLDVLKHTVQG